MLWTITKGNISATVFFVDNKYPTRRIQVKDAATVSDSFSCLAKKYAPEDWNSDHPSGEIIPHYPLYESDFLNFSVEFYFEAPNVAALNT